MIEKNNKLKLKSINSLIRNRNQIIACKAILESFGVLKFTFDNNILKRDMINLAFSFGIPRKIKYLLTDKENDLINVVMKKGKRNSVFGDIWHSDHAYEKIPPNYTLIHCPTIPPYGGDTLFSFNKKSYDIFSKKYGTIHDNKTIINTMPDETKYLLKTKYPSLTNIETCCEKSLVKKVNGIKVFACNRYHTIASKQKDCTIDKKLLETIFSIQESKKVIENISWEDNQIIIWNNDLVLHKASNDYDSFDRKIWRILIDTQNNQ